MLDILKLKRPSQFDSWALDGISILSWIEGAEFPSSRGKPIGLIQHDGAGEGTSAAWIDEELKLVLNPGAGECGWIDGNYSDASAAGMYYLFNLTADPRESVDLKHDPAYASTFATLQAAHVAWTASVYTSRSQETLCDDKGPPAPTPPTPPGPGPPPSPAPAGSFTLSSASDVAACITVVPTARSFAANSRPPISLLPCATATAATQSWFVAPVKGGGQGKSFGDGVVTNWDGALPDAGFLKVNLKASTNACDAGNSLTVGKATGGKVDAYFQWQSSRQIVGDSNRQQTVDGALQAAGKLTNYGCPGMCLGADASKGARLVACTDAAAKIIRTPAQSQGG